MRCARPRRALNSPVKHKFLRSGHNLLHPEPDLFYLFERVRNFGSIYPEQLPEVVIDETFNEKREHAPAVKLKEF